MGTTQRVAVLITYYNERFMLRGCLQSLYSQNVPVDEVLIYDDCSLYPAVDYLVAGRPVRVIRATQNKGPSTGRNRLLEECSSEYVHFHDADDLFRPNWCESVRSCVSVHNPDVILSDVSLCQDGIVSSERFYEFATCPDVRDLLRLAIRLTLVPSSGTYRRDAVYRAGRYDGRRLYGEDYAFHLRLALSGARHSIIREPLVLQCVHGTNRSLERIKYWAAGVDILTRMLPVIPTEYHPDVAHAAEVFGSALYRLGHGREARRAYGLYKQAGGKALLRTYGTFDRLALHAGA
jgi:glycosyltransferase involved in cell wall biosynthesis